MSRLFMTLWVAVCALATLATAQNQGTYTGATTSIAIPNAGACQNARGLAVDSAGLIYIACGAASPIVVMDQNGVFQRNITLTQNGVANASLWNPFGIAFSGTSMYVTSLYDTMIYQLNTATGAVITQWNNNLYWPWGIAVDSSNNVWVANYGVGNVVKFSSSGQWIANFSTSNPAMNFPEEIAIDPSGNVYVVDTDNNRVVKFNSGGSVVATYSSTTPALNEPGGIALDTQGSIYVCDTWNYAVIKLNSNGQQIETLSAPLANGTVKISAAAGLAIDSSNQVYVLDSLTNNRVLKFPATLYSGAASNAVSGFAFVAAAVAAIALALL